MAAPVGSPRDALVVVAGGFAASLYFGWPVLRAWRGRGWQRTQGTVTAADFEHPGSAGVTGSRYRLSVTYRYTVDGVERTGNRASFFQKDITHRLQSLSDEARRRYGKGKSVDVWHDPSDPAQSVLDPRIPFPALLAFGFSVAFFVLGVVGTLRLLAG